MRPKSLPFLKQRIEPIFYQENLKERFHLELEKARIEMKLRLKGKHSESL